MDAERLNMTGFLASHEKYDDFREFISRLLETFMDDTTRDIYMSEKVTQIKPRQLVFKKFPATEEKPLGVDDEQNIAEGPFAIIKRAFTHKYLTSVNMESLETLGDGILNETVTFIIVSNWPNILLQPAQVANMKKYHTNNVNIAKYAAKLGLIKWVVRHPNQGLDTKERADIFEALIGAIALIGEFYIGPQMGLAYARLFLTQFFATVEWYPENPGFYEAPETMYNDWTTALPGHARPKMKAKAKRDPDTGIWHYWCSVEDNPDSNVKAVTAKVGVPKITFSAQSREKDDAKHAVRTMIAKELKLSREDINIERDKKRAAMADIQKLVKEIVAKAQSMQFDVYVSGAKRAGQRTYVFVNEKVSSRMNDRVLKYERILVSGEGGSEKEALEDALNKLVRGRLRQTIAGFAYEIWNPDVTGEPNEVAVPTYPDPELPVTKGKNSGRGEPVKKTYKGNRNTSTRPPKEGGRGEQKKSSSGPAWDLN